jgi:hypothetical protein
MHVLIDDKQGLLTMRRLWPWQRILARSAAGRLDSALARGAPPEASVSLAARAARLTSMSCRFVAGSRVLYGVRGPQPPSIGGCVPQAPNGRARRVGCVGHKPRLSGVVCHKPRTAALTW